MNKSMHRKNGLRAIVAGAGIGGLAVSAALAQRGWRVTAFESQDKLRTIGSGIYIWENGLRVLEALGAEAIVRTPFRLRSIELHDQHGDRIDFNEFPPEFRVISIPRCDLLDALRDAARSVGVEIVTGSRVVGASAAAEFLLANGATVAADLAVGADGTWSQVRESLGLEVSHAQSREGALRTIIPGTHHDVGPDSRGRIIEAWSGMRRFLITMINDREMYLALTCPAADDAGRQVPVDKSSWQQSFPRWSHLIERIGPDVTWNVYSTVVSRAWSAGRTAIVGDAAHAQPPNLGQGGGMAMQNGLALATYLADVTDPRDIPDTLRRWEAGERELIDHCQRWSNLYGELTFLPDEILKLVVEKVVSHPWVRAQIMRAAASRPTGT